MNVLKDFKTTELKTNCNIRRHQDQETILVTFSNCSIIISNQLFENLESKEKTFYEILPILTGITKKNSESLIEKDQLHELHINQNNNIQTRHKQKIEFTLYLTIGLMLILTIITMITIFYKKFLRTQDEHDAIPEKRLLSTQVQKFGRRTKI